MTKSFTWMLLCAAAGLVLQAETPAPNLLNTLPLRFEPVHDFRSDARFEVRGSNFTLRLGSDRNRLEWKNPAHTVAAQVTTRLVGANHRTRLEAESPITGSVNYFVGSPENWRTDVPAFSRVRYHEIYAGIDLVFHGDQSCLEYDFIVSPRGDPRKIRMDITGEDSLGIDPNGDLVIVTAAGAIRWKKPDIYQESGGKRVPVAGRFVILGKRTVGVEVGAYETGRPLVIDPALSYSTYFGGSGSELAGGIAVDGKGNVYIAGTTSSTNLPTISAYQANFGGMTVSPTKGDGFIAKFNPAGALVYLTYLGGSRDDLIYSIALDSAGNAYVTGSTTSLDFPTVNAFQKQFGGVGTIGTHRTGDAFVAKLSASGNQLLYSTYLGGSQDEIGMAIAVDSSGSAYITGATNSIDFPMTPGGGEFQSHMKGAGGEPQRPCCTDPRWDPGDAFVAKLDPTGSQLMFSTYLGGFMDDIGLAIGIDASNNVYVGGCTISYDFPVTQGSLQTRWGGSEVQNEFFNLGDGFVTKLNPTGSALVYSTYFGGTGDDCVKGIAVDASGNVYMTGTTSTTNLPTTPGAFQPAYAGYTILPFLIEQLIGDAFVAKLNPSGSSLIYLSYLGGSQNDGGTAIAIDGAGNAYIAGFTESPDFPLAGNPLQSKYAGGGTVTPYFAYGDAFLAQVNPTATSILYSTYFGGTLDDAALAIALDGNGDAYMAGATVSSNLMTTPNARQPSSGGFSSVQPHGTTRSHAFYTMLSGFAVSPPVITSVTNAFGGSSTIAPNTWVAIKGTSLAPDTRQWLGSDFINNQLPTSLDGVSVLMNGQKAYIYYISATQINALTPPNLAVGPVQVQVVSGTASSSTFASQAQTTSPSLFVFDSAGHVVAQHVPSYTDVGPTSLYPGLTTPAHPGEEIAVYGNGFGVTSVPVVAGSITQSGTLPGTIQAQVVGQSAQVLFAGLAGPGLYQFNIILPANLPSGDVAIGISFNGQSTQSGTVVTIQP